jgi:hypothetical protein
MMSPTKTTMKKPNPEPVADTPFVVEPESSSVINKSSPEMERDGGLSQRIEEPVALETPPDNKNSDPELPIVEESQTKRESIKVNKWKDRLAKKKPHGANQKDSNDPEYDLLATTSSSCSREKPRQMENKRKGQRLLSRIPH